MVSLPSMITSRYSMAIAAINRSESGPFLPERCREMPGPDLTGRWTSQGLHNDCNLFTFSEPQG